MVPVFGLAISSQQRKQSLDYGCGDNEEGQDEWERREEDSRRGKRLVPSLEIGRYACIAVAIVSGEH